MATRESKKPGAKPKYDRAGFVPAICKRLFDGEPMAVICRGLDIPIRTVNQWRADDPAIAEQFTEAFEGGMHAIAWRSRQTARGKGDSTQDVQRDKLIIDTDLKLLARWAYALYGEKQQLDHTSSDGTMTPKGLNEFYGGLAAPDSPADA